MVLHRQLDGVISCVHAVHLSSTSSDYVGSEESRCRSAHAMLQIAASHGAARGTCEPQHPLTVSAVRRLAGKEDCCTS